MDSTSRLPKFRRKQLVRHKKTQIVYRIIYPPSIARLERDNTAAYVYQDVNKLGPIWCREQGEMEDGRFEAI